MRLQRPCTEDPGNCCHVLLVEDDKAVSDVITTGTVHQGFRWTVCSVISTALTALKTEPFDAVLLDITLPDSTWPQTLDAIATQVDRRIPIVVLTGGVYDEFEILSRGAIEVVYKPENNLRMLCMLLRQSIQLYRLMNSWRDQTVSLNAENATLAAEVESLRAIISGITDRVSKDKELERAEQALRRLAENVARIRKLAPPLRVSLTGP